MNATKPARKLLFTVIALLLPFLVLLVVEITLRAFGNKEDLSLFVDFGNERFLRVNHLIDKRYFNRLQTRVASSGDLLLKQKPENGYRIFVMGGSTAAGFPYPKNLMFSTVLQERLQQQLPYKYIEIVNVAITATNSYTYVDIIDEMLRHQPDAILIYGGHNEFYGALGVCSTESLGQSRAMVNLALKLNRLHMVKGLRDLFAKARQKQVSTKELNQDESLMTKVIANNKVGYKGKLYTKALKQFEGNMDLVLKKAKSKKVSVILSELVSNVKDMPPFEGAENKALEDYKKQAPFYRNIMLQKQKNFSIWPKTKTLFLFVRPKK
ncbi:MAG: SGNH/GDSL hydrolase family protein [Bacteroidales bacterium]|nr:SGNH/GDSL hydrolase family protein [Bacteroidales bacterium]